jgi:asparagine synthase (glutamine-hydrolysing)
MRSDVKVGSTLSSGLDSSSIVGILHKLFPDNIQTFTAYNTDDAYGHNDKAVFKDGVDLDESTIAKKLIKEFEVDSNFIQVSFSDYLAKLSDAIYYLESGHSSPATISIHQVYKEASKKIRVLLEGQGADELLAGYVVDCFPTYLRQTFQRGKMGKGIRDLGVFRQMYSLKYLAMIYLRSFDSTFLNSVKNAAKSIDIFNNNAFQFTYTKDNLDVDSDFDEPLNKQLFRQHTSGLVNLLHYGDALSMAESIECRLPFMDYRLVEFAFTLPYDYKINGSMGKYIQRKALASYVPDYISNSVVKIGFVTPLDKLFRESKDIEYVLLNQKCGDLFDDRKVERLLVAHRTGRSNHATLLFRILSAKLWFKTFFE